MEKTRGKVSRRAAIGGGLAALAGAAFLEHESFEGRFDHRSSPGATNPPRYAASLAELDGAPSVVHVGHSTHLISLGGLRFLTDPWFFDPAFGALVHEPAPAVHPESLGPLDVILISHDHADHADLRALDQMDKRAKVITSTNDLAARIRALGFGDVSILVPWEERKIGVTTITAVPAQHDIYEIGFVVQAQNASVYFAGDTRLHPDLPAIAERFHPDLSILPVDGTRLLGGGMHVMTPDDAVEATRTLKSRLVMPSHAEAIFSDPLVRAGLASTIANAGRLFGDAMAKALPSVRCVVPAPGERVLI